MKGRTIRRLRAVTTRTPTVERLLHNDGHPQDAAHLIALIVRNLMEVKVQKGAARVLPPVDGGFAGVTFHDLFDDLRTVGRSNIYQRLEIGPRGSFSPGSGRQIVMADQLRDVAHLMKLTQCQLVGRDRGWALLDAYIKEKGRFRDRSGSNHIRLGRLRSTPKEPPRGPDGRPGKSNDPMAPYRFLWSDAFIRTSLAAALPSDILDLSPKAQVDHMKGLPEQIEQLWKPHADSHFPFEIFTFMVDFSLHKPQDILATIESLRPDIREPAGPRAAKLAQPMHELLPELADLFDARTGYVRARFTIENGQPMLRTRMVRVS